MSSAIIITGDKVQDHEFIYPYYRLQEEEFVVDVAVRGEKEVLGYYGTKIPVNCDIPSPNIEGFYPTINWNVLILPGGAKAMEYMRQDPGILKFIAKFHEQGGIIGSICHGAQLLISAGLVRGKMISGYYSIKDDIENAGGIYKDSSCVTDFTGTGVIITSPHYKYLGPWMKEVLHQVEINK